MALMVLPSWLLSLSLLLRSFCDHSVHRMRIGRASDAHRMRIRLKFGCASDMHSMCSSSAPCLCLGAPHKTFGLALVLLLGSSALPWFSSSAPVLGPVTRCSARNLWPRVSSPPWLLGLALVLILGPIPRPGRCSSVPFFGPIPWRCFGAPHKTLGCAPVPRSRCPSSVPTGPTVLRTKPSLLRSSASVLPSGKFLI
jgi:hypothetical protein